MGNLFGNLFYTSELKKNAFPILSTRTDLLTYFSTKVNDDS